MPPFSPFSGIGSDLKSRIPLYKDDWITGFRSQKALSSGVYTFFINILPALSFANLILERTNSSFGALEVIVSMALAGVIQSLFAGQPLVIVGVTGPIVLLLIYIFDISKEIGYSGFTVLFLTCSWSALMMILLSIFNMNRYFIKIATNFSGQCFGFLISMIYVYEGSIEVSKLIDEHNPGISLGIFFGMIALFVLLDKISLVLLQSKIAQWMKDYALAISVVTLTLASLGSDIPRLGRGDSAAGPVALLRTDGFGWTELPFRDLGTPDCPVWLVFACLLPALMLTALLYFDHNISSMITQRNLKKPTSYDWDFLLLSLSIFLSGVLGIPPAYGLIPQAPLHARSLATVSADGTWIEVVETRIASLIQSLLILLLFAPPLQQAVLFVPRAVLAALFFVISVEALLESDISMRFGALLKYFLIPNPAEKNVDPPAPKRFGRVSDVESAEDVVSSAPTVSHNDSEPTGPLDSSKIDQNEKKFSQNGVFEKWLSPGIKESVIFLSFQIIIVAGIFAVNLSPIAMAFPLFIVLLLPLRLLVFPRVFSKEALIILDPRSN